MSERFGVRSYWLIALVLALLAPLEPAAIRAQGQGGQTVEGTLTIRWGDPRFPGTAGAVKYILETADGRYVPVEVTQDANEVARLQGQQVVVNGRMASRPAVAGTGGADVDVLVADSIAANPRAAANAGSPAGAVGPVSPVSGTKKVLFLLLKYSDDGGTPHPPSFFLNLTNPDPSVDATIPTTINQFFRRVSNNTFSWVGELGGAGGLGAPGGYLILPQPKSYYANCNFSISCLNFTRFDTDAINVGKAAGINFTPYDTINFVINNDLDCCAWGGGVSFDGKTYGATWEPPWGQITSTYGHELGHSLGLLHSGWVYYSYDSPWDTMSSIQAASSVVCGSYFSRNRVPQATVNLLCDQPGNGYIAGHRDALGWIPPANQVSVNSNSPGTTVTLEGNSLPLGAGVKLIKICIPGFSCTGTGTTSRYFTVEARVKNGGATTQYDNAIPNEGVIIHDVYFGRSAISGGCYFNNQSGWAVPVDSTPGDYNSTTCTLPTGQGLYNAQFSAGQTYTNNTYGFKVTVVSRSGNNFVVNVQSVFTTQIDLNGPANGATVSVPFTVQGWAVNRSASSGTGVDMIHVYAAPNAGGAATFLGQATYGVARADIAALYGSQFTNSGFTLNASATLAPGSYTLTAYARNAANGSFDGSVSRTITVSVSPTNPFIDLDTPREGYVVTSSFEVGGWALDLGSPTGTGVDAVQFYVYPNNGASPGVFIGNGTYGLSRPDVAGFFGSSRFTNTGFHFSITGLGPGAYVLGVNARSTVTGGFTVVKQIHFTVNAFQLMAVSPPAAEAAITGNIFDVDGWSIDKAVESTAIPGTGVDTLHVYAYPNPGSGAPAIFLGVAAVGLSRPDVASIYGGGGPRYVPSGFHLAVDRAARGLTPGVYSIVVFSHSTVTGTFNNAAVVRVTLQ